MSTPLPQDHPTPSPPLFGFCGASDSGKTTLVSRVIAELAGRGYAVGAIKHHGHRGPLEPADRHKDSGRLFAAGAARVALAHAGGLMLTAGPQDAEDPVQIARRFMSGLDLVLVEGYKSAPLDKIEVVAPGREPLLPSGGRLLALAQRGAPAGERRAGLVVLDADDPALVTDFVLEQLGLPPRKPARSD